MRSIIERNLAIKWKSEGLSYYEISDRLGVSRNVAINLCLYKVGITPRKRGPKFKLNKAVKLIIKTKTHALEDMSEKVNAPKIKNECKLEVSISTVQRHLRREGMIYKRIIPKICLTKQHKVNRIRLIKSWISSEHDWNQTIFSDEKRFSLDGPDHWASYVSKNSKIQRMKRQCKGGSVMIWMMAMPNGLLSFRVIEGILNSDKYINLLQNYAVPTIKLNYEHNFWFQEDNASVHKSKKVKAFMDQQEISILEWPAKSPDLNIVEDCWKLISDMVYDGKQFRNKNDLVTKITNVINDLNSTLRPKVLNLYKSIRHRLCGVLEKQGNLYNC